MNLEETKWEHLTYQNFMNILYSYQDINYKSFHSRLILDQVPLIGIRTPILKQLAKQISRGDYLSFIQYNKHNYYEEIILHGLILGDIKIDFQELLHLLDDFLPYNQNWAINDIVCANLKQFRKNQKLGFKWILKLLQTHNIFGIRFGLVLLLDYYLNDHYIDAVLKLASKSYPNSYYVNMGIAWLLSVSYIKYPEKIILLLKEKKLNNWIHNKTISKIRDSHRVSIKEKNYLKALVK